MCTSYIQWYHSKYSSKIQGIEACNTHNQGPHTFQCNQYDGWDQSPWTYEVPIGDFCSTPFTLPVLPKCAEGNERDAPKISITDAEGTDCSIEMYKAPSDPQNMECLSKLTNGNGQDETWLVFVVHGFCTDCHGSTAESWDWGFRLREGVLARYEKIFSIIHLYITISMDLQIQHDKPPSYCGSIFMGRGIWNEINKFTSIICQYCAWLVPASNNNYGDGTSSGKTYRINSK